MKSPLKAPRALTLALLLMLALSLSVVQRAQAQLGGAAVVFLMIEPDSRAAGMGNTGVAQADNVNAIFWNPAGLANQRGTEIALTHSNWLPEFNAGLFYEYLVVKHHVEGLGTFGGHLTYLFLGDHECRDAQNVSCGNFKSYDLAAGLSYGFNVSDHLALGTGLRLIYSNLAGGQTVGSQETNPGVSAGFDFAGLLTTSPFSLGGTQGTYRFGFNLANMGPKIQYSDSEQSDPIPTNLRFGQSLTLDFDEFNSLTLSTDFNKMMIHTVPGDSTNGGISEVDPFYKAIFSSWGSARVCQTTISDCNAEDADPSNFTTLNALQQMTIGTGFEYWYNKLFALRGGYFYENPFNGDRQFLTFGAGIRYNIVGVDFSYIYALEENHPLSDTIRFSLLIDFLK